MRERTPKIVTLESQLQRETQPSVATSSLSGAENDPAWDEESMKVLKEAEEISEKYGGESREQS